MIYFSKIERYDWLGASLYPAIIIVVFKMAARFFDVSESEIYQYFYFLE